MLSKFITVFKIPELRNKILLTLGLLAVYRMGFAVPLPFIDQDQLAASLKQASGDDGVGSILAAIQLFSASNFGSIFGLGIMPYITASIIFQLLGTVYPPLEALQKEGEAGRRKINEYTRWATVVICLVQSWFFISNIGSVLGEGIVLADYAGFSYRIAATVTMTAGTIFLMWIGEQVDAYGIGNGISLLIMAGILARMPTALVDFVQPALQDGIAIGSDVGIEKLIVMMASFIAVIVWVIAITQGQRRIPIQSAKHVRGRRVMGGQRQFMPLRVNQAGVMPIIFASSLLIFPRFIFQQLSQNLFPESTILSGLAGAFQPGNGFVYNLMYVILIYFFCYFWTAITFNPKDMANNLKDYGSFIPGYRPGGRTAQYLEQIMVRITYVGAAFLAMVAIIPTIISEAVGIPPGIAGFFGGTGLLIVVSVGLDLVQKIDSHLVMRNYSGMLESDS